MAYFSQCLGNAQKSYSSVEKEAMAVVEAVKHWSQLLRKRKFTLITDQRSVAFMYDNKKKSKIKNIKIMNWRMELGNFQYNVKYRPGRYNEAADALTRVRRKKITTVGSIIQDDQLYTLHKELGCPGIRRLFYQ